MLPTMYGPGSLVHYTVISLLVFSGQSHQAKTSGSELASEGIIDTAGVRVAERDEGVAFTLPQVKNNNFQRQSGLQSMIRAFSKFNASLTPELRHATSINPVLRKLGHYQKRDNTTNQTAQSYPPLGTEFEYVVPVSIGTPPQLLYLDVDTGSSDLWVMSTETTRSELQNQRVYSPSNSSTSKKLDGYSWKIGYGDGSSAYGDVYTDSVAIGNLSFFNQSVESAVSVSPAFTRDQISSGLLGLAMSSGNTVKPQRALTFFDNVYGSLREPLFTVNLEHGKEGAYNFGYIDDSEYTGTIQYVPIFGNTLYWEFLATGYSIGKQPAAQMQAYRFSAIADTGTSLLLLPKQVLTDYYSQVEGAQFNAQQAAWVYPCTNTLPDFAFGFGSYRGVLPGSYIDYGVLPDQDQYCYGGIQSSEGLPFSIFGDILLKAQFVVFDLGGQRLGFANKNIPQ